ncbi:c-type cytochrome [Neisseria sp. RH3002v2g]|uniref:c-type cytochrome n=1 Tax=Neisseria sp. RH3002v2g TaxID=1871109 RepID=UPI0016601599|nr:c-type cytochrome [Neisseria sp. RH3002v2g]
MNKLLIAVMMMAGLTACSQEAKQETQETAQAVASEVKTEAASAADATASAAQEAADKVEAAASKAEEAAKPEEKAEAPAAEAKPAESAKVDGKAVFEANCKACHGGLIPGAPAVGKKEDWAPRIKQGKDTLHKHALEGFNSMPAKGGNSSLSDDEVKAAVDYMANESGAKF